MNCKTCKWCKIYFTDDGEGLEYHCTCDSEIYKEEELFDCNEHNMRVEIEPK